mmetsp:Transcript_20369/g.30004  ORF Transcript_20369/g.30004 Transcript_20369/m.30004 type:complete len:260 (+) Transcript_20369:249-1028(+)
MPVSLQFWTKTDCTQCFEETSNSTVFMLFSPVKGRLPILRSVIQSSSFLYQKLYNFQMTPSRSFMKWSPSICILFIDDILKRRKNLLQTLNISLLSCFMCRSGSSLERLGFCRSVIIGMSLMPPLSFWCSFQNIRWQTIMIRLVPSSSPIHGFFVLCMNIHASFQACFCASIHLFFMTKRVSSRFKVDKEVCIETAFEWEWASVQHRMRFIQYHISGLHRNIVCLSIMSIYFNRPRFVNILCHIDDSRRNERKPINVCG